MHRDRSNAVMTRIRCTLAMWFSDGLLKNLFANAGILLGGKGINALFSLGAMAVAARGLGTAEFGVLILIHTFTQTMGQIAKFQSWQAILRFGTPEVIENRIGNFQRLLRFTIVLDAASAVVGMGLVLALSWVARPLLGWTADLQPTVMLYATSVLFMVTATPTGVLRLVDRFDLISAQDGVGTLTRLLISVPVWLMGGGITGFLVAWYVGSCVGGLYLFYVSWRELKRRHLTDGFRWRGGAWTAGFPGIWSFVWSTNLNTTLGLMSTHVSTLAVGWLLGPADAALFRVARQIGTALAKPAKLLVPAIYPELAKLYAKGEFSLMRTLAQRAALMAGGGAVLSVLIAWLFGAWLLGVILGPDFVAAYPVMLWLVAAAAISVASFPLEPILISGGEAGTALRARLLSAILYVPVLLLMLKYYGLIGGGWAQMFATIVTLIAFFVPVVRWFRTHSRVDV